MSELAADEIVRRIFEARAAGDVRRTLALLDPEVEVQVLSGAAPLRGVGAVQRVVAREATSRRRVEVEAQRVVALGEGEVLVHGRVRVFDGGSLADSPAAWRVTVRRGRIVAIEPHEPGVQAPGLRRVA